MADNAQVMFEIPKEVIDAQVKAAVIKALNEDPEKLVQAVVQAAMQEPDRNSYGRSTIWDSQVNKMIRAAAMESFHEWLDENKEMIKRKVRQKMEARKGAFITKITDAIADAMSAGVSIDMKIFKDAETYD